MNWRGAPETAGSILLWEETNPLERQASVEMQLKSPLKNCEEWSDGFQAISGAKSVLQGKGFYYRDNIK